MDTELVDRLVLQLNRIHPQILSDKEAHRVTIDNIWHCFGSYRVLTLESAKLYLDLEQKHSVQVNRCVQWFNPACVSLQFRNLSVPTKVRLAELLKHLNGKGEEACHEFYRGLHIHAEDVYSGLPTRVTQRGKNTEQDFSELQTGENPVFSKMWSCRLAEKIKCSVESQQVLYVAQYL